MKICSAVPENGCLIILADGKNKKQKKTEKKTKKNNCKTYTHPPPTGRRLRKLYIPAKEIEFPTTTLLYHHHHYHHPQNF